VRFTDHAWPQDLSERGGRVCDLVAQGLELAASAQELAITRVLVQRAVQVSGIREHRDEASMRCQIHWVKCNGSPEERERSDPIALAQQQF